MSKSNPIDPNNPKGTSDPKQGDDQIRKTNAGVIEIMDVDHYVGADGGSGYDEDAAGEHATITLREQTAPSSVAENKGKLYTKEANSIAELHFMDENEAAAQITRGGSINLPAGSIQMYGGTSAPAGWLLCQGQEISQTTYADLYAALGADAFGTDAGGNFFLPDMKGRIPIGVGTGDASDATAHALAEKEGAETHTLDTTEMPAHTHTQEMFTGDGSTSAPQPSDGFGGNVTMTTDSRGGGDAHNNLQPSLGLNFIIKT